MFMRTIIQTCSIPHIRKEPGFFLISISFRQYSEFRKRYFQKQRVRSRKIIVINNYIDFISRTGSDPVDS